MRFSSSAATLAFSSATLALMVNSFWLAPCSLALAPARAVLLGPTTCHHNVSDPDVAHETVSLAF